MRDIDIPFYSNTEDNTHCFQAGLRMVMKYFWPEEEYTWDELDRITAKVEGLWTWPTAGILWLLNRGMEVQMIDPADYKAFVQRGGDYLIELYGKEVGEEQIKQSDISQEQKLVEELLRKIKIVKKIPQVEDIKKLLEKDYLVACNVNACTLDGVQGYVGHFVIVKGYQDNNLIMHDPGLPPRPNRVVNFVTFEEAWAYPSDLAKNIIAFKFDE